MWPNPEEILNGKPQFLCSVRATYEKNWGKDYNSNL